MYSYPKLSKYDLGFVRVLGPGIGNLLFPWARSVIDAEENGWTPIFPTWPQIDIGPILKGHRSCRFYSDLFKKPSVYASGFEKSNALFLGRWVSEEEPVAGLRSGLSRPTVVIYQGMEGHFEDIIRDHERVRSELLSMTKEKHKEGIPKVPRRSVCVHVRLGDDFDEPGPDEDARDAGHNTKLPLSWYKRKLSQVRSVIGESTPVHIFSDVDNDRLEPILEVPNTSRAYFGSSIADMLALSQAGVLIASGSTFSMWASYLGRMPVIWYPGQRRQRLYYENEELEIESGPEESLPHSFGNRLEDVFADWSVKQ